jgi:hypothetical protein
MAAWRQRRSIGLPGWAHWSPQQRFLWLWLLLPLLVFCLSRSRMWLYVLPLFAPLALLVARGLQDVDFSRPVRVALVAAWIAALLALKAVSGDPPGQGSVAQGLRRNSGDHFAARLRPLLPGAPREFVFVEDKTRYSLHLYFKAEVERVSFKSMPKRISDADFDKTLAQSLLEPGEGRIYILKQDVERYFLDAVNLEGLRAIRLGALPDERGDATQHRVVYTLEGDFP